MGIVGERLRLLREKNGKTQEDISRVIGTTQQIYSRYETSKTELPVRHLLNLSSYYNVSTDFLLGRIDYPKIPPEFSNYLIQNVTIGDFVCRIDSFSGKSKRQLVDYVNYLTYLENTEKLKKDEKPKNLPQ
ncbi:helix-turn-helix domain-containing protein [Clostridium transplantifaecale]|uniref:helix-turn-helix domain-containing protein n=1 Tax=Clostridium transplantifaecale TaxID=2479838 RepID=UPI000F637E82|nr:helix-turn-helix transcriptional regulator [Clostridium transplantifaecale]